MSKVELELSDCEVVAIKGNNVDDVVELYESLCQRAKLSGGLKKDLDVFGTPRRGFPSIQDFTTKPQLDSRTPGAFFRFSTTGEISEEEIQVNMNEFIFPEDEMIEYDYVDGNLSIRKNIAATNYHLLQVRQRGLYDYNQHQCALNDPGNNSPCTINMNVYMASHHCDAINISAHNIRLLFKSHGRIVRRSLPDCGGNHPDAIQLIPGYRFAGGQLHNITIESEKSPGDFDIDLRGDSDHQGIMASDGIFHNLRIRNLSINTEHPEGIFINGMRSGEIADITLAGNAKIVLNPIRLAGGRNIFIASPDDEPDFYQEIEGLEDLKNKYPDKVFDRRRALDNRGSQEFQDFISGFGNITVYKNFPVEQLNSLYCNDENSDSGKSVQIDRLVNDYCTPQAQTPGCEQLHPPQL